VASFQSPLVAFIASITFIVFEGCVEIPHQLVISTSNSKMILEASRSISGPVVFVHTPSVIFCVKGCIGTLAIFIGGHLELSSLQP
jgi:hypothetical protein